MKLEDIANHPDMIIEKIRNKKDKYYVTTKFPGDWTEAQVDTWERVKLISPRVRLDDDKIYTCSLFYASGKLFQEDKQINVSFIKQFFKHFYGNIEVMLSVFDHTYLNFNEDKDKIKDPNNGVSFDGFSFSIESLKEDMLANGVFFPMYAYIRKQEDSFIICGGRHRRMAINELIEEGRWDNRETLCIFWDSYQMKDVEVVLPNLIIDETLMYIKDGLEITPLDIEFSKVKIKNIIDLWLILKIQEKEVDFMVEKYENDLLTAGIKPSKIVNPWIEGE